MRRILLVGGAVLAVGALGACSGSSDLSSGSGADLRPGGAAAPQPKNPGGEVVDSGAGSAAGGKRASAADHSVRLDGGVRIRTADLTVAVRGAGNVAVKADAADDIAIRAGGDVDADDRTTGSHATATLRLRVPPASLLPVLRALSKLGEEKARQLSSKDVTEQVADVDSRVASAQQAIARLRGLYAKATRVSDVITIEAELGSRESDLESLQAQQRALRRQTEMASVTLYLHTLPVTKSHEKKQGGFLGGLSRGWDAFVGGATAVATGVGAALPFVVLLVLLVVALRLVWPRLGRHPAPAPAPAPSE